MIDSNTAILLDADMLAFAAASATEVEVEFAPDIWTRHSELPAAREYFWNQIDYWCDEYEATRDDVILCFTERSQFRRDLAPSYKANRKGSKPIGYKAFKNELMQHHGAFMFHRIEADDLIGIFATTLQDKHVVIASGDKDLNQIPGHHTWINKEDWIITDEEAQRFTYNRRSVATRQTGYQAAQALAQQVPKELLTDSTSKTTWDVGRRLFGLMPPRGKRSLRGKLPYYRLD